MPDETALRKPDCHGVPIVLADGKPWLFRKPVVRFVAADNDAGFEVKATLDGSDNGEFGRHYKALSDATTDRGIFGALFGAAKALLLPNYDLRPADFPELLQVSLSEEDAEGRRIFEELTAVVQGQGPKQQAGGEG